MFIKDCLTPKNKIDTVLISYNVGQTLDTLEKNNIWSIPVVDDNDNFIGMISKRTLFEFQINHAKDKSFKEFMDLPIENAIVRMDSSHTIGLDNIFEDCLPLIVRYPFIAVVEDDKFLGIVKRSDIEKVLEKTFAVEDKGTRLLLGVPDFNGIMKKIVDILTKEKQEIVSFVSFDAGSTARRILVRISKKSYNPSVKKALEDKGIRVVEVTD